MDLDKLECLENEGIDTLLKAFKKTVELYPLEPCLGTRIENRYEWMNWAEASQKAEFLSYAMD